MLRIAVPNKGTLSEAAAEMLREAGYAVRRDAKELVVTDVDNDVEFFYLRPRDIAIYVGSGTVDAGITGRDLLLDSASSAVEVMTLGFGRSTFRYAARPGDVRDVTAVEGRRVATSYPGLVEKDLAEHGVHASVVRLDGAVETAITLGVADVIADVVETGATLRDTGWHDDGTNPWHARSKIYQATGMVVSQLAISPDDALALLKAHAYAHDASLDVVAGLVLDRQLRFTGTQRGETSDSETSDSEAEKDT
jgi:ATP phosphoribosyltransferase